MTIEVAIGPPVSRPAGVDEDRLTPNVSTVKNLQPNRTPLPDVPPDHYRLQVCQVLQRQFGKILAIGVTVERRVQVRPRVRHHVDLADVELGPGA